MPILERLTRGVAQAFHALRDEGFDVAVTVIAMLGEITQELRIRLPRLEQSRRHRVHLDETLVAKNDIQLAVGIGERTRHVVEGDAQLRLLAREVLLRLLARSDVGIRQHEAAVPDRRIAHAQDRSGRKRVFQLVRLPGANPYEARLRLKLGIAGTIVASPCVEAIKVDDLGAGLAQRRRIAAQDAKCLVARDEPQVPIEYREPEVERIETRAQ